MVERCCALTERFARRLASEPGINVLNAVTINQAVVSFGTGDPASRRANTERVIARVQRDGVCFVGGAEWRGEWAMRLSVTSSRTTEADIDISADAIIAAWRAVRGGQAA
jgi:glutamate/tyrosine decarboxylase-like PLP-dependent enzyme